MATQISKKLKFNEPAPRTLKNAGIVRVENYNHLVEDITTLYEKSTSPTVNTSYGLTAQGTSASTTSILSYDINVFTTVTLSDYATKLPQPVTGKSVVIVNRGVAPLYVYPSNPGGEINNLGIDQPAIVPPDGQGYSFYCIENPQPGQWVVTGLNGAQLQINPAQEITVNHTTGSPTLVHGWIQVDSGAYGIVNALGGGYTLSIPANGTGPTTDYFITAYTPQVPLRSAVAIKWQTNGTLRTLNTDPVGSTDLTGVKLSYTECFSDAPNSVVNLINQAQITFAPLFVDPNGYSTVINNATTATVTFNPGGPNFNGNIGDLGAVDAYIPFTNPRAFGDNGFSNVYFIVTIDIPAASPTGAYKFVPYFEYY